MKKGWKTPGGKPFDLRKRTVDFEVRILEICERLPDSQPSRVVQAQLSASGTSIGANIEKADELINTLSSIIDKLR